MPRNNTMESSTFLLLFLLGYCLAVIEGELRCYCNESGCVSTGYMCKSSAGQCFTSVEIRGEVTHQTHGCLDSLPKKHQESCRVGVDVISTNKADLATGQLPFLLCCKEHMCNYREDIDISIILTPKYNGTFHRGNAPASEDYAIYSRNHHSNRDDDRDLWFKAAVIAVPIAGGFILVLLVLLAVRMLRTDSRQHRRLIHIRRERSLTKAHMYISDHFSNKVNKQHFTLFNKKTNNSAAQLYSDMSVVNGRSGDSHTSKGLCCNYSLQTDNNTPSPGETGSGNQYHITVPRTNHSNTKHVTCSTKDEYHSRNIVKPDSFITKSSSKNPCLSNDITVKVDKSCHTSSQANRPDFGGPSYQYSSVALLDNAYLKGPTATV